MFDDGNEHISLFAWILRHSRKKSEPEGGMKKRVSRQPRRRGADQLSDEKENYLLLLNEKRIGLLSGEFFE